MDDRLPTPRVRIIFIRHAQAQHNYLLSRGRRDEGHNCRDARITPQGEEEIATLRLMLRDLHPIHRVISSPLTRALQTAIGLFGSRLPVEVSPLITEKVNPSQADMGRSPAVLRLEFPSVVGLDALDPEWWPQPGTDGEPYKAVQERGKLFVDALASSTASVTAAGDSSNDAQTIVVVTHGTFLKELSGITLPNGGVADVMLFASPELCNSPPPGYFGRFTHMAWASYGGKHSTIYDTAATLCFQPSKLQGTPYEDPLAADSVWLSGFVNPLCVDSTPWAVGDVIATLPFPEITAPPRTITLAALAKPVEDVPQEVQAILLDIHPSGHVVFCGGFGTFHRGYVCLTGVQYSVNGSSHLIRLADNMSGDARYSPPSFTFSARVTSAMTSSIPSHNPVEQRFALLHGRVGRCDRRPLQFGDVLGTISLPCFGNVSFVTAGSGGYVARIDVTSEGTIVYRGCAPLLDSAPLSTAVSQPVHYWVTLSGLLVPLKPRAMGSSAPLVPSPPGMECSRGFAAYYGHAPYAGGAVEHLPPKAFLLENGLVTLIGLVVKQGGAYWHKGDALVTCDPPFRPAVRQVFHVIGQHNQLVRLDVLPDGRVLYIGSDLRKAKGETHIYEKGWVSLSGITFLSARFDVPISPVVLAPSPLPPRDAPLKLSAQPITEFTASTEAVMKRSLLWKWQFKPALFPSYATSRSVSFDESSPQETFVIAPKVAHDADTVPFTAAPPPPPMGAVKPTSTPMSVTSTSASTVTSSDSVPMLPSHPMHSLPLSTTYSPLMLHRRADDSGSASPSHHMHQQQHQHHPSIPTGNSGRYGSHSLHQQPPQRPHMPSQSPSAHQLARPRPPHLHSHHPAYSDVSSVDSHESLPVSDVGVAAAAGVSPIIGRGNSGVYHQHPPVPSHPYMYPGSYRPSSPTGSSGSPVSVGRSGSMQSHDDAVYSGSGGYSIRIPRGNSSDSAGAGSYIPPPPQSISPRAALLSQGVAYGHRSSRRGSMSSSASTYSALSQQPSQQQQLGYDGSVSVYESPRFGPVTGDNFLLGPQSSPIHPTRGVQHPALTVPPAMLPPHYRPVTTPLASATLPGQSPSSHSTHMRAATQYTSGYSSATAYESGGHGTIGAAYRVRSGSNTSGTSLTSVFSSVSGGGAGQLFPADTSGGAGVWGMGALGFGLTFSPPPPPAHPASFAAPAAPAVDADETAVSFLKHDDAALIHRDASSISVDSRAAPWSRQQHHNPIATTAQSVELSPAYPSVVVCSDEEEEEEEGHDTKSVKSCGSTLSNYDGIAFANPALSLLAMASPVDIHSSGGGSGLTHPPAQPPQWLRRNQAAAAAETDAMQ